jgi:hypothetical protein
MDKMHILAASQAVQRRSPPRRFGKAKKRPALTLFFVEAAVYFLAKQLDRAGFFQEKQQHDVARARADFAPVHSVTRRPRVMMSTWEKLQGATMSLARSGSIKDRLTEAYRSYIAELAEDDLPREMREEFRAVTDALTRERPMLRGEDAVRATLRKMSCEEADRVACSIVRMFAAMPRVSAAPRAAPSAQVVPLYLAEA